MSLINATFCMFCAEYALLRKWTQCCSCCHVCPRKRSLYPPRLLSLVSDTCCYIHLACIFVHFNCAFSQDFLFRVSRCGHLLLIFDGKSCVVLLHSCSSKGGGAVESEWSVFHIEKSFFPSKELVSVLLLLCVCFVYRTRRRSSDVWRLHFGPF